MNKLEQELKNNIGFKTAFKATLGFYAGQTVATFLGLLTIISVIGLVVLLFR